MPTILHIDASARPGRSDETRFGSHSRRLSAKFVDAWRATRPYDPILYRDVGQTPPAPVTKHWIHAAFTPTDRREEWMHQALAESDTLVDELLTADVIVAGVPMYNFGMPAQFKAYIDNIVRVGRTFGFDRSRDGEPYWPMVPAGKQLVVLSSRGDFGYGPGERLEQSNHVEPGVRTPFAYIGITQMHSIAVEYDEFADDRLQTSLAEAEQSIDVLVARLTAERQAA